MENRTEEIINGNAIEALKGLDAESVDLVVSETGYKSHFFPTNDPPTMEEVVSMVTDWLDTKARSSEWQTHVTQTKQMSLF